MYFSTSMRLLSANLRYIAACPVKGGKKLITNPVIIFLQKNCPKKGKFSRAKGIKSINKLHEKWNSMTKPKKAPYVKIATANRKKVEERKAIFRESRTNGFILYMKANVRSAFRNAPGTKTTQKWKTAITALGRKWKRLPKATKTRFNRKAERVRAAALAKSERIIKTFLA